MFDFQLVIMAKKVETNLPSSYASTICHHSSVNTRFKCFKHVFSRCACYIDVWVLIMTLDNKVCNIEMFQFHILCMLVACSSYFRIQSTCFPYWSSFYNSRFLFSLLYLAASFAEFDILKFVNKSAVTKSQKY